MLICPDVLVRVVVECANKIIITIQFLVSFDTVDALLDSIDGGCIWDHLGAFGCLISANVGTGWTLGPD